MNENLVLIGYRGAGKSVVGRNIAEKTRKNYISTDELIVDRVGPIDQYIREHGWSEFRELEHEIILDIETENSIIDCGGGVIELQENYLPLKNLGIIFWLKAKVQTIIDRIKETQNRPALTDQDFISEIPTVLERRIPLYRKFADYEIATDNRSIEDISQEIINKIS